MAIKRVQFKTSRQLARGERRKRRRTKGNRKRWKRRLISSKSWRRLSNQG
jgi:hypothetical protein